MKKRSALIAFAAVLGIAAAFILSRHLTAPTKPPGGWYQGGEYELMIVHSGGISGMTRDRIRVSNKPPQINLRADAWPQIYVSGKSADEIVQLLNQYNVDQWGHEAHFAGLDHVFYSAYLSYQGKEYKWTWHGSQKRPNPRPPPDLYTKLKGLVKKPKYPMPHSHEMEMLRYDILQIMHNNTNDLTFILPR